MANYKASQIVSNTAFMQAFGNLTGGDDTVTVPALLATNDTIDLIRIAGGTRLQHLSKVNGRLDNGTTLQYSIGVRPVDANGLVQTNSQFFASAGQSDLQGAVTGGSPTRFSFPPVDFNEDVFITMTVNAGATSVSGFPTITTYFSGVARGIK